jgi:hypothetical protein
LTGSAFSFAARRLNSDCRWAALSSTIVPDFTFADGPRWPHRMFSETHRWSSF